MGGNQGGLKMKAKDVRGRRKHYHVFSVRLCPFPCQVIVTMIDLRARETLEDTPPPVAKRAKLNISRETPERKSEGDDEALDVLTEYKYLEGEVRGLCFQLYVWCMASANIHVTLLSHQADYRVVKAQFPTRRNSAVKYILSRCQGADQDIVFAAVNILDR